MNVVEIFGLTHRYGGRNALRDVSLAVPESAVYALLGENGAGKTTLLRDLMGLQRQTSGAVQLFGRPRRSLTFAERASIGYVAEAQRLPGWMSLRALERFVAPMHPTWDFDFANELRARFRLDPGRAIDKLSRGERMKAAVLCALAARPRLLVLDEPFTGIDVAVRDELVRGVLLGAGEHGTTVLVSSHDVGELESIADWVGFLERGVLRFSQPIDDVRERFRDVVPRPSLREIFLSLASGTALPNLQHAAVAS